MQKSISFSCAFLFVLTTSKLLAMFMLKTHVIRPLDADAEKHNLV